MRRDKFILEHGLHICWVIAFIATIGSLYFSEIASYLPCKLCWYQRIMMYPLVIILGIAAAKKEYRTAQYVLPMTIIGGCISLYHYLMEKTTWIESSNTTCGPIPCDYEWINWLGFITIPFLALTAFMLITILQLMIWKAAKRANA
ncbi:MAG TPA: disulfide oxidoreductase [Bacilli bacterium]